MVGQQEPQRQVDRMVDAYADRYQGFLGRESVVSQLQRRLGVEQIQAIVNWPSEFKCLAQAARSSGQLPDRCIRPKATISCHLYKAQFSHGFQGSQQNASGLTLNLAGNIHAKITAVDCVHIGVSRRTEDNLISRSGATIGVCGRVGRIVVRAEVSLHLHNSAHNPAETGAMREQLAQQARSYQLGRRLNESPRQQTPGWPRQTGFACRDRPCRSIVLAPALYLCALFHSLIRARTSSAWPSGVTLGKMCSSLRSGPMRKVVRSIPITFFPYMFFSFKTPN